MVLRLKENLLIDILSPHNLTTKYSKSLLNLKTLMELEMKETDFKIPVEIQNMYNSIVERENKFISGIPLKIIEKYYFMKSDKMNSYINIEYLEEQLNIRCNEVFMILEEYYSEMYLLASIFGNYYNLEIKINQPQNNEYV